MTLRQLDRSLLNPHFGAISTDVLTYRLQPLVRVPHLMLNGVANKLQALPLDATCGPDDYRAVGDATASSQLTVRDGQLFATFGVGNSVAAVPEGHGFLWSPRETTSVWRPAPGLPEHRYQHSSADVGGATVVYSGITWGRYVCSTYVLPPSKNVNEVKWRRGADFPPERSWSGAATICVADPTAHRMLMAAGTNVLQNRAVLLDDSAIYGEDG